jgi:glycosyltransferase involved in cell wall biosynthesis
MHIGLEATTLRSPGLGGVWRYTDSLIRALARHAGPHRYSLLFVNRPWAKVAPPDVPPPMRLVNVTSISNFLFTFFWPPIPRGKFKRLSVDSFLGPVNVFHSINTTPLPQRQGRRVVTVHDLTCLLFPQFHPWDRRLLFRLSIRRAARLADAIIVPSAATGRDLAARFPSARTRIRVVPHAPSERFVPLRSEDCLPVLARHGLAHGDYLLFVGNVEPRKNLRALIEAYGRMRQATPLSPQLAIAGGAGWKHQGIHQAAATSPVAADIRFLGHVSDADLPSLVSGALAFVYPSLYEGFGLPPLEAMACGTPVITSNRSSLPEVVGDAALVVDPNDREALADAMERLVSDATLREEFRARGLERAQRYSWDETARRTIEVYEDVQRAVDGVGTHNRE